MAIYPDQPLVPLDPGIADYLSRSNAYAAANGQPINLGTSESVFSPADLRTVGMPQVSYAITGDGRRVPVYAGVRTGSAGYSVPGDGGFSGGGTGGSVARALPATRQDLWNTVYGPTQPTFSYLYGRRTPTYTDPWARGSWVNDPHSNPSLAPATEDDRMLAYDDQAHQLAQQVYKRGTADQAQRRVQMLQSLLQSGASPNLYDRPRNAQDADLQNFIQQDYNAGVRGWGMIPTQNEIRRKQQENLRMALERQKLGLDQAKFVTGERRSAANDQFTHAFDRAKFAQTSANERSNLGLRQDELIQRQAEAGQRAQDALDRKQVLADYRNQKEALDAVKSGMDPETAANQYGIDGTGREVLKSWGQLGSDAQDASAGGLNELELMMRQQASDSGHGGEVSAIPGGWFSSGKPAVPPSDDRSVLSQLSPKQLASLMGPANKAHLSYDPLLGFVHSGASEGGNEDPDVLAALDSLGILGGDGGQRGAPLVRSNLAQGNFGDASPRTSYNPSSARPTRAADGLPIIYSVYDQAYSNMRPGEIGYDGRTGKPFRR